jgi:hypothetical protein
MDSYRNIVMFGNARWREDTCGNSSQQLGLAFLQLGYRLLYITPNPTKPVSVPDFSATFKNVSISYHVVKDVRKILKQWSANPRDTVFICSIANQYSEPLMRFFDEAGYDIVYRHVDWLDQFSHPDFKFDRASFLLAGQVARLITVSHPELVKQFPVLPKKIITQTNGVDFDLFCLSQHEQTKPLDLVRGTITVGFWGTFWGSCIDWPLIRFLASRNSAWSFNLIADLQYLDTERSSLPSNVYLLGLKVKTDLPSYIRHFDLCFIPFRTDQSFAVYANPIKALESLAGLKPIVSPRNTSLESYPAVFAYNSAEEAEKKIQEAVRADLDREAMADFARKNTWQKKAITILQELQKV